MEEFDISGLVKKIALGSVKNIQQIKELIREMHEYLNIHQEKAAVALEVLMDFRDLMQENDFEQFKKYLTAVVNHKNPSSPMIRHLYMTTKAAVNAVQLVRALFKVGVKERLNVCAGFFNIQEFGKERIREKGNDEENKKVNCLKMIGNLKYSLGINLKKTIDLWGFNGRKQGELRGEKKRNVSKQEKEDKEMKIIKVILKNCPIFEQAAFWRWKFTVQAWKEKEKRLYQAVSLAESLLRRRGKTEALQRFRENLIPLWYIHKKLLQTALEKVKIRYFYIKIEFFSHWCNKIHQRHKFPSQSSQWPLKEILSKLLKSAKLRYFFCKKSYLSHWHSTLPLESFEEIHEFEEEHKKTITITKRVPTRPQTPENHPKVSEFILKNLAKVSKISLFSFFSKWKNSQKSVPTKQIYSILTILNRIYISKAKRVFHPPQIIKDADEIMKRTIKKLTQIKNSLFDSAITRWKYYKNACYTREKASALFRACQLSGNCFRDAFYIWREKTNAIVPIKRTAASGMLMQTLSKAFRARFKSFLFKSFFKIKPKKALARVWSCFDKKYSQNTRSAFQLWMTTQQSEDLRLWQINFDMKLANLMRVFNKNIDYRRKRGFYAFMKNSRHLKIRIFRTLVNAKRFKKFQCWDTWKNLICNETQKYKALKMKMALNRALKKPLKTGFLLFVTRIIPKNVLSLVASVLHRQASSMFTRFRVQIKLSEVVESKKTVKGLQKTIKKVKLRSHKADTKSFQEVLKTIIRVRLNVGFKEIVKNDKLSAKSLMKTMISKFLKRPKFLFDIWKRFVADCKTGEILDAVKAAKLTIKLNNLSIRTLRNSFQNIFGGGNRVKGIFKSLISAFSHKLQISFHKWKTYILECEHGKVLDQCRASSLRFTLSQLTKRTLRNILQRLFGNGDRVKGTIKVLIKSIEKMPKDAFSLWKDFVNKSKQNLILDALKTQRLRNALGRVPIRSLRSVFHMIVENGNCVKGAIRTITRRVAQKPKFFLAKWEKVVVNISQGLIFDACRTAKLKFALSKLPIRTVRNCFQRVLGGGNRILGTLKNIIRIYKNLTKSGLEKWKLFTKSCVSKHYFDLLRTEKLKNSVFKLLVKTLRTTHDKIIGMGNILTGALKTLGSTYEKMQKIGFGQWKKYIEKCKSKKFYDNFRSLNLKITLSKIVKPQLIQVISNLFPNISLVKKTLNQIFMMIRQRPKKGLEKWKAFVNGCKRKDLCDNLTISKLKFALGNIPKRVLRGCVNRIIGNGNIANGALKRVFIILRGKTKSALVIWKSFVQNCKSKVLYDNIRSINMQNRLRQIITRSIQSGFRRILGEGNIAKGALRRLIAGILKKPKLVFSQWKEYIEHCKKHQFLSSLQSYKLKISLEKIPLRVVKDAFQRLVGSGDKAKGALKTIFIAIDKKSKLAFAHWKYFSMLCQKKFLINNVKSQKLFNSLTKIPKKTLNTSFHKLTNTSPLVTKTLKTLGFIFAKGAESAFALWKLYIISHKSYHTNFSLEEKYKAVKMKILLDKTTRKVLRSAKTHAWNDNFKVKTMIKRLEKILFRRIHEPVRKWFVNSIGKGMNQYMDIEKNRLGSENKAIKLEILMGKVIRNEFRKVMMQINPVTEKVARVFKYFDEWAKENTRISMGKWVKFSEKIEKNMLLTRIKTLRLKDILQNIVKSTVRRGFLIVIGEGNRVKGAIRRITSKIQKKIQVSLRKWVAFVGSCKQKTIFDAMRSYKLLNSLSKITAKTLKSTTERIIGDGSKVKGVLITFFRRLCLLPKTSFVKWQKFSEMVEKKQLLNSIHSEKLKNSLQSMTRRKLRDCLQRIQGEGNKVKGAIKKILTGIRNQTKFAVNLWKKHVNQCNHKQIFDNFRSEKVKNTLFRLLHKVTTTVIMRIIGGGSQAKGKLASLMIKLQKLPKSALQTWKSYTFLIKHHNLLDRMRATKLKSSIFALTIRTLRLVTVKIIRGKGLVRNALKLLMQKHREGCKKTLQIWAKFIENCKHGDLIDAFRREKLKSHLINVNKRFLRDCIVRILGKGDKIKGNVRRIIMQLNKRTMLKFQSWKTIVAKEKEKNFLRKIKGLQLKGYLVKFTEKNTRGTVDRIFGNGKRALGAIRRILTCVKIRYFNSFTDWKEKIFRSKQRDAWNAGKLKELGEKLAKKCAKMLMDAVLGDSSIRRMFNKLIKTYKDIEKSAFYHMWARVEKIRTIKKMNSAYFVSKHLIAYCKKVLHIRFTFWKNIEFLRRRRILKKATGKMIQFMSISYESALWKWKIVLSSTGAQLSPKHSFFFKRLFAVSHNYQKRLEQFALFKMVLNYKSHPTTTKLNLPQALAKILKSPQNTHSRSLSLTSTDGKIEYQSNISTLAPGSISKEEAYSINQIGALEIVFLQFRGIISRKFAWGMSAIKSYCTDVRVYEAEKSRFIEEIMELRYEKHSLLEDNNTLRLHNDSLVTSLENNTMDFQDICLQLDHMRLTGMIRMLSRLVEYSMYGAFAKLSNN